MKVYVLYVWILKKMYMLSNLWQNILCKAQYLKLQYFWFWGRDKTYQKDFEMLALHGAGGQSEQWHSNSADVGFLRWTHTPCVFSPTRQSPEDPMSQRARGRAAPP